MNDILVGIISGVISSGLFVFFAYLAKNKIIPVIIGAIQQVPNIEGTWNLFDDNLGLKLVGNCLIVQHGNKISMTMERILTRHEKPTKRTFVFKGRLVSSQLVMIFEEKEGKGYITGATVLHLSPKLQELKGLVVFHDNEKNKVISLTRVLKKL